MNVSRSKSPGSGLTWPVAMLAALATLPCRGIEMFTFFGDGSRIGLPSLEVPVEAYRGIPLRSDRLRARRASRWPAAAGGPPAPAGAMISVIPETAAPSRTPWTTPRGMSRRQSGTPTSPPRRSSPAGVPVAPEPPQQPESIPAPRN